MDPQLGRVDVGHGQQPTLKEARDLLGIDAVILGFSAVDRSHVEGMAKDELDLLDSAQVRKPCENALNLHFGGCRSDLKLCFHKNMRT